MTNLPRAVVGSRTHAIRVLALASACFPVAAYAAEPASAVQQEQVAAGEAPGEDIVVTGSRASREAAIERKRALPTIADVVASDDIGKLPDYNTAEALQRLPGVSVQIDQGEPRYVIVRGIDPNLNQVTVDGNLVGIPEAEGRRVALDTIPSDLVSAIEVVKAVTPDYDANAIGGSINLVTPTAFDKPDAFTYVTARGSYNHRSDKLGFGGAATHGQRFGPDDQFGIVIAGSYSKRFIDSDLAEPTSYTTLGTAANRLNGPTNFILYDYRIMRERIGGIVNLDWRPSEDVRVYVRSIYNEFTDHEERDQFNIALVNGAPAPTVNGTQITYPNTRATRQFRQNDQTQKLYNISPGAEFRFGAAELNVNYTFAHAQEHTPIRDDLEFRQPTTAPLRAVTVDVSTALPTFVALDPRDLNPADFQLRRIRERREKIDEDLNTFRADLKVNFSDDDKSFVKVGGKFIKRVKDRDNTQTQRDAVGTSTFAQTGAVLPTPEDFYKGRYDFGPAMNYQQVLDYYAANPGLIAPNAAQTRYNERSLDYRINEKIYAGYAMVNFVVGDLTAIGGVRVERTEGQYNAFQLRGPVATAVITPLTFDQKYTHVLPSVHLNYRARPDVLLRAAWTNTIGRPNYDATVPTFTEDNGAGTAGNPDLKPYTSMGLDFSAEYYPGSDSILSLGVFYKRLKNPIFTQTIQNTTFGGVALTSLSQPLNADRGKLFGVEVNAQKRFTFLPDPLDGFGVSANGTYIDSSVKVPGRLSEDLPFFRQSKWIANAALFYEKGPFEARVAMTYRSPFIENVGSPTQGTTADIYQYGRTVFDARLSYKINDMIEVFGSISNINEAPLSYYQTNENQTYSREMYSYNGDFGVSVRF
jgi:TonB-dependent receptor